jgi:hypothetical protein
MLLLVLSTMYTSAIMFIHYMCLRTLAFGKRMPPLEYSCPSPSWTERGQTTLAASPAFEKPSYSSHFPFQKYIYFVRLRGKNPFSLSAHVNVSIFKPTRYSRWSMHGLSLCDLMNAFTADHRPPVGPIGTPYGNSIRGIIHLVQEYHGQASLWYWPGELLIYHKGGPS